MRLAARPLKGDPLDLEVEPSELVEVLKAKIAAARPELPADQQKIVHAGRVLSNGTTLEACGVKDGDFVVVMIVKKPAGDAAPAAPAPASLAASASADPTSHDTAAAVGGPMDAMDATVQMLCDMGFPRSEVERCLRAAFNNPDRAVEYLTSGIPAGAGPAAPAPASAAPMPAAPQVPAPFGGFGGAPQFPMGGFPGPRAGAPPATGPLAQLRNHPRFLQLRMVVQQNPQALNSVLSAISMADPSLIPLIAEHQEEFVEMLQEPVGSLGGLGGLGSSGSGGAQDPVAAMLAALQAAQAQQAQQGQQGQAGAPAGAAATAAAPAPAAGVPQLSPAEQQAVERLQALGFDRRAALEAYLACDRNEEVAADYLFENLED